MSKYINIGDDGTARCWWCGSDPLYVAYHDREWGEPVYDDRRLFEKICLEGFQAGLSWLTILKKREAFRDAFGQFEIERVCRFNSRSVQKLLNNEQIVRHRGKIEATINNAKRAIELAEDVGSLSEFFWQFEPDSQLKFDPRRSVTDESKRMSRELKKRGWKFVGATTCYSFMQAMGFVNDHHPKCFRWSELDRTLTP